MTFATVKADWKLIMKKQESDLTATIRLGSNTLKMPYSEAITHGYLILRAGYPKEAHAIFVQLLAINKRDRWTKLLKLRAEQQIAHLGVCLDILELVSSAVSTDTNGPIAQEFRKAIALRDVGLIDAAATAMSEAISDYADLPTACLNIGDMLAFQGFIAEAIALLTTAKRRAKRGSPTARTARRQIQTLSKKLKKLKKAAKE